MSRPVLLAVALGLSGLGYLALAWYVWRYRAAAGARALIVILLAVGVWTTSYALELSSRTVANAQVWSTLKYLGVVGMPPALLIFALEYTGRREVSRQVALGLAVVPVLTMVSLVLPATKDWIHFYDPQQRAAADLPTAPVPHAGPLFWPHAGYNYGLAFAALALGVFRLFRSGRVYRVQAWVVLVTAAVPLLTSIAYNAGWLGQTTPDPLPFLFTVLAVVLVWGFFRLQLLDLMPVARDVVLEQMADAVVVLDVHERVVDANPAAAGLLLRRPADLVGRYLSDLVPPMAPLLELAHRSSRTTVRGDVRLRSGVGPGDEGSVRDLAATMTALVVRGQPAGRLVLLHDVTERQAAQRHLHELLAEQTRVADALQAGLRPASLPQVEGVQLAVRSVTSSAGGRASGNFYDLHRVAGGDWAFVMGDVSGKGVEAAVLTSMARYTVRTLSAEGRTPPQVIEQLNRALLLAETDEWFCTLVYGRLDGADLLALTGAGGVPGSPGACVHLSLVLSGHPRPLLRRRDGDVTAVGTAGTALGLTIRPDAEECVIELESGDVLLVYSYGLTQARRGTDQFGEQRLAQLLTEAAGGLRGRVGVSAAHLVAEAIADRVLTDVTRWALRHDDLAVLVLAVA